MKTREMNIERKVSGLSVLVIGSVMAWLVPAVSHAADQCGGFGDQANLSKYYDTTHECGNCAGQRYHPLFCGVLNRMVKFDPAAKTADAVLIPHRGIWGGVGAQGASENTLAALWAARNTLTRIRIDGYRIIEIDAMLSDKKRSSASAAYSGEQIKMSHYFDMYAYGGKSGESPRTTKNLGTFRMNKRDGSPSADNDDRIASINDAINFAVQNDVMLTIDPKVPDVTDQIDNNDGTEKDLNEYAAIVAGVLHAAKVYEDDHNNLVNALGHITIKSTFTPAVLISQMEKKKYLGSTTFAYYRGKFFWSPIINKSLTKKVGDDTVLATVEDMKNTLKAWYEDKCSVNGAQELCVDPRHVLTIETQIYNGEHWSNNKIDTSANLIRYVEDYTKQKSAMRRATLWSVDPAGHLGTLSREYTWKFIGNDINEKGRQWHDLRSNPVFLISRDGATHSVIITDRPDVYESMLIN